MEEIKEHASAQRLLRFKHRIIAYMTYKKFSGMSSSEKRRYLWVRKLVWYHRYFVFGNPVILCLVFAFFGKAGLMQDEHKEFWPKITHPYQFDQLNEFFSWFMFIMLRDERKLFLDNKAMLEENKATCNPWYMRHVNIVMDQLFQKFHPSLNNPSYGYWLEELYSVYRSDLKEALKEEYPAIKQVVIFGALSAKAKKQDKNYLGILPKEVVLLILNHIKASYKELYSLVFKLSEEEAQAFFMGPAVASSSGLEHW